MDDEGIQSEYRGITIIYKKSFNVYIGGKCVEMNDMDEIKKIIDIYLKAKEIKGNRVIVRKVDYSFEDEEFKLYEGIVSDVIVQCKDTSKIIFNPYIKVLIKTDNGKILENKDLKCIYEIGCKDKLIELGKQYEAYIKLKRSIEKDDKELCKYETETLSHVYMKC